MRKDLRKLNSTPVNIPFTLTTTTTTWNCVGSVGKCIASCGKCGTSVYAKGDLIGTHKCD